MTAIDFQWPIFVRMVLAVALGTVVGYEREHEGNRRVAALAIHPACKNH